MYTSKNGFTLIELLLAIGIIAILASVVIIAVNPVQQLGLATARVRQKNIRNFQNSINQYIIDYTVPPGDKPISTDGVNPTPICRAGKVAGTCVNIDELMPTYLSCIPYNEDETDSNLSGYKVFISQGMVVGSSTQTGGYFNCIDPPVPMANWEFETSTISTTLEDASNRYIGAANNIVAPSGPSTVVPTVRYKNRYSYNFDGIDDYIRVPYSSDFDLVSELTIAAWIYPTAFTSADVVNSILRKGEANPNTWQFAIEDSYATLMLEGGDGSNGRAQSNVLLSPNTWYHVAATWNGTTAKVFVNGALTGSGMYSGSVGGNLAIDARDVYIGGRIGSDSFSGRIDSLRVYNTALTDIQIAKMAAGNP